MILFFVYFNLKKSYYVKVPVDSNIEDVAKFIAVKWLKRSPKIILPVITGLSHFKTWKNQKQLNKFKRGIIKAAYTTELIYITNGYNTGVSKLIGDAFREESLARRTSTDVSNSNYNTQQADEFDKLILMGIVSTSDLKNIDQFKKCSNDTITYKIDEQDNDLFKYSLNPDHTHFILVDDDNLHIKLLKFRVALEKRLQKPIFTRKSKRTTVPTLNLNNNFSQTNLSTSSSSFNLINDLTFVTNTEPPETKLQQQQQQQQLQSTNSSNEYDKIPIVCLLIGGGVGSISLVLTKIYQGIPVLALKGTGHAPDLICGTYEDFADRYDNMSDNHLRTAITIRITEKFPKESKEDATRNKIKDTLLQIIKFSKTQVIIF